MLVADVVVSLRKLGLAIPRFAPDFSKPDVAQVWGQALAHLPQEAFALACRRAVMEFDAYPSIRELLSLCGHANVSRSELMSSAALAVSECIMGHRGIMSYSPLAQHVYGREQGYRLKSAYASGSLREADILRMRHKFEITANCVWLDAVQGLLKDSAEVLAVALPRAQRVVHHASTAAETPQIEKTHRRQVASNEQAKLMFDKIKQALGLPQK